MHAGGPSCPVARSAAWKTSAGRGKTQPIRKTEPETLCGWGTHRPAGARLALSACDAKPSVHCFSVFLCLLPSEALVGMCEFHEVKTRPSMWYRQLPLSKGVCDEKPHPGLAPETEAQKDWPNSLTEELSHTHAHTISPRWPRIDKGRWSWRLVSSVDFLGKGGLSRKYMVGGAFPRVVRKACTQVRT